MFLFSFLLGLGSASQQPLHRLGVWWLEHAYWVLWNREGNYRTRSQTFVFSFHEYVYDKVSIAGRRKFIVLLRLWFSVSSNLVLRRSAPRPPPLLYWPIETMAIWTTFICWYVNQSFIFFFDDLFQILAVYENFHIGQVLCASCPDSHTLITGGTSTVSMTSPVVCMTRRNYALAQGIEKRKEVEMVNCIKDSLYWMWLC